ncbi:MAG TPA: hypothetical protein VK936_03755, partial [Longimicrobiales bacterium]|nr:hypothetical protein [Longimicrobiales bacterium]
MHGSAGTPRRSGLRTTLGAGIALAALLGGAAHFDVLPLSRGGQDAAALEPPPIVPADIRWLPEDVVEGTVFTVVITGGDPAVTAAHGEFAGERLHFTSSGDTALIALAAAPLDSAGVRELRIDMTLADGRSAQQTAA